MKCPFAYDLWHLFDLEVQPLNWHHGFINWLDHLRITSTNDSNLLAKVLILFYNVWHSRNKFTFQNSISSPMQTLHAAAKMTLQYWSVNPFHQIRDKAQHEIILWKSIDNLWKKPIFMVGVWALLAYDICNHWFYVRDMSSSYSFWLELLWIYICHSHNCNIFK